MVKSTCDEYIESLSPRALKKFKEGYRQFAFSELLLAIMDKDEVSVQRLAKITGVSPTVVQAMCSGSKKDFTLNTFFKVLRGLGCSDVMLKVNGKFIPLSINEVVHK